MAGAKGKSGNKPGRRGPYTRKGISDAKKVAITPKPTLDLRKPSGIAEDHGGVMNRKKTIDTYGMKYLKG